MRELDKVLNENEQVVWEGKPQARPYFIKNIPGGVVIGGIFIAFSLMGGASVLLLIGAAITLFSILIPVLNYNNLYYAITDKRIIIQSGIIGRDFVFTDYDKVTDVSVDVGIIDKLFGKNSGTIRIMTPSTFQTITSDKGFSTTRANPYRLLHITDPYVTFQKIKKTSFDVKADIHYPNALRPEANAGYNTIYKK